MGLLRDVIELAKDVEKASQEKRVGEKLRTIEINAETGEGTIGGLILVKDGHYFEVDGGVRINSGENIVFQFGEANDSGKQIYLGGDRPVMERSDWVFWVDNENNIIQRNRIGEVLI